MSYPLFQHRKYLVWKGVSLIGFRLQFIQRGRSKVERNIRQRTQRLGLENHLFPMRFVLQYLFLCLSRHPCHCIRFPICFTRYKFKRIVEL